MYSLQCHLIPYPCFSDRSLPPATSARSHCCRELTAYCAFFVFVVLCISVRAYNAPLVATSVSTLSHKER